MIPIKTMNSILQLRLPVTDSFQNSAGLGGKAELADAAFTE